MHLGHLDQTRQNLQSIKPILETTLENTIKPTPTPTRTHALFAGTHLVTGKVRSNQIGRVILWSFLPYAVV
jgi:hypothetical protein